MLSPWAQAAVLSRARDICGGLLEAWLAPGPGFRPRIRAAPETARRRQPSICLQREALLPGCEPCSEVRTVAAVRNLGAVLRSAGARRERMTRGAWPVLGRSPCRGGGAVQRRQRRSAEWPVLGRSLRGGRRTQCQWQ